MKILLSWSSGKDSAWALHLLQRKHPGAVGALLTTVNEAMNRVAMHGVRREVLEAQANAAGLPLRVITIPHPCSNEIYESRMRAAVTEAVADGFTHAAFGDLFLEDIRRYRERQLAGSGLTPLFPVWGIPTDRLAHDMIGAGLKARLSCVDTRILGPSYAGREFNATLVADLPAGVDPCGENGEFHTCVYDGPMFEGPIRLHPGEKEIREPFAWADLTLAADDVRTSAFPVPGSCSGSDAASDAGARPRGGRRNRTWNTNTARKNREA
ncbi:MAG TPA: hypothetical protein VL173_02000 [Vicinamibacterales bacterium]|nr:hypothetical protein [Vicinamibacterales bacterium]